MRHSGWILIGQLQQLDSTLNHEELCSGAGSVHAVHRHDKHDCNEVPGAGLEVGADQGLAFSSMAYLPHTSPGQVPLPTGLRSDVAAKINTRAADNTGTGTQPLQLCLLLFAGHYCDWHST